MSIIFFIPLIFILNFLQRCKLLVAWRLVEWGKCRQALLYCELLANELLQSQANSNMVSPVLPDIVHLLVELSSALKSMDPSASLDLSGDVDPDWLQQLKQLAAKMPQVI